MIIKILTPKGVKFKFSSFAEPNKLVTNVKKYLLLSSTSRLDLRATKAACYNMTFNIGVYP